MERINTSTAVANLFGAGKSGFQDGAMPATPATILNAAWFNGVQEEIAETIEAAGIALDGSVYNQLLAALNAGWGMPMTFSFSGVITLPGGWILEFGPFTCSASGSTTITLPEIYNHFYAPFATSGMISLADVTIGIQKNSLGSITIYSANGASGSGAASSGFWFTLGY